MIYEGTQTNNILFPTEVDVPWDDLDSSASGLKSSARAVADSASDVGGTWTGLQTAYQQPSTQDVVWSAMDDVPSTVEDWAETMESAGSALQDFVEEGRPLQARCEELKAQARALQVRLTFSEIDLSSPTVDDEETAAAEELLREDIAQHNSEVLTFNSDWRSLESRIEGDLIALQSSSGVNEDIPEVYATGSGGVATPVGTFSSEFDLGSVVATATSGELSLEEVQEIAEEIEGNDDMSWADWAAQNPELAAELAENELTSEDQLPEGAEDLYGLSQQDQNDPATIDAIAETWNSLEDEEQWALLMMFPAVFGNMNGVKLEDRGRANAVHLQGQIVHHEREVEELNEEHRELNNPRQQSEAREVRQQRESVQEELNALETAAEEMRTQDFQVIYLDTEDAGQFAGLYGSLDGETEHLHTNVPGSESDLTTLGTGLGRTKSAAGIGSEGVPDDTAAIYWQGMDTPPGVLDNVTASDDELLDMVDEGAESLAAFDYAVNMEIDQENVRTSYDAHSFAASVIGTAAEEEALTNSDTGENYGVQADAITIMGPVGFGQNIESRDDLANEDVEIYWVETRSDVVDPRRDEGLIDMPYMSHLPEGVTFHDLMGDLDVVRLESGVDENGELLENSGGYINKKGGGHGSYFTSDSESLEAIQRASAGEGEVVPYVDDEIFEEHVEIRAVQPEEGADYYVREYDVIGSDLPPVRTKIEAIEIMLAEEIVDPVDVSEYARG